MDRGRKTSKPWALKIRWGSGDRGGRKVGTPVADSDPCDHGRGVLVAAPRSRAREIHFSPARRRRPGKQPCSGLRSWSRVTEPFVVGSTGSGTLLLLRRGCLGGATVTNTMVLLCLPAVPHRCAGAGSVFMGSDRRRCGSCRFESLVWWASIRRSAFLVSIPCPATSSLARIAGCGGIGGRISYAPSGDGDNRGSTLYALVVDVENADARPAVTVMYCPSLVASLDLALAWFRSGDRDQGDRARGDNTASRSGCAGGPVLPGSKRSSPPAPSAKSPGLELLCRAIGYRTLDFGDPCDPSKQP